VEASGVDRLVDRAPPDRVFGPGLIDDVFVARGAPGMAAGIGDKGAAQPELTLPARNRVFVVIGRGQVPMRRPEMVHPLLIEVEARQARRHRLSALSKLPSFPGPAGHPPARRLYF